MNAWLRSWADMFRHVCRRWRPLLTFQIGFGICGGIIASLLLAGVLNMVVRSTGTFAVTNYDLIGFFLSTTGLVYLFVGIGFTLVLLLIDWGGVLWLVAFDHSGPVAALRGCFARSYQFALLGWWVTLGLAVLLLPFAAILAFTWFRFLNDHDINYYLYHQPREWWWALGIAATVGIVYGFLAFVFLIRLLFTVPIILFENASAWQAIHRSRALTAGQTASLGVRLGGWQLLILGGSAALAWGISRLGGFAIVQVEASLSSMVVVTILAFAALLVVGLISDTMTISGNAVLAVQAFRDSGGAIASASEAETRRERSALGFIAIIGIASIALAWWTVDRSLGHLADKGTVLVTAHRAGSLNGPENTLAALEQAIADGADFAEIDVQTSRDGALVILHDADFQRVAGDPRKVADLTLTEMKTLDVGRWHSAAFTNERMPTLAEMITTARGRIRLNIELKYNRPDPTLVPKVVDLVKAEHFIDDCVITSLESDALLEVHRLAPELRTGLIVTKLVGDPARVEADFLAVNRTLATERLIHRAHTAGKQVHVWTINDARTARIMIDQGVDNLITDRPAEAKAIIRMREELSPVEEVFLRLRYLLLD